MYTSKGILIYKNDLQHINNINSNQWIDKICMSIEKIN